MRKIVSSLILTLLLLTSCGEFNKILKSTDYELKYQAAKKYFDLKQYGKTVTLLEELVPIYKGTERAEETLFLLGKASYLNKDYYAAAPYFTTYYSTYPKGEYTEMARFYCASSYFNDSPEPKLDQTETYKALTELNMYLEYYPQSEHAKEATGMIEQLQDKLARKEYLNAKLYYDLGNYMGNNYQSAVIAAQNGLRDYPNSKYREEFFILTLRAKYDEARHSVEGKKHDRYRDVVDEYYNYKNEYPQGKYIKEAEQVYKTASRIVKVK